MTARVQTTRAGYSSEATSCGVNKNRAQKSSLSRRSALASKTKPLVQPKLRIGTPNDKFEQEADSITDQVM